MNDGPYMAWAENNTFACLVRDMVALMLENESDGSSVVVTSKRILDKICKVQEAIRINKTQVDLTEDIIRLWKIKHLFSEDNVSLEQDGFHLTQDWTSPDDGNLQKKLNALQHVIVKNVVDVEDQRNLFHKIPDEILLLIFYAAIPPSFLLDTSLCAGPNSPWCLTMRTKRSIIRVCRQWWQVGIEMFYEQVVFRQFGQIPSFVRTLENSTVNMGGLIKKINICSCAPDSCQQPSDHVLLPSAREAIAGVGGEAVVPNVA